MNNLLGFIGGSGLYDLNFLDNIKHHDLNSFFGHPSDKIIEGSINGNVIFFYQDMVRDIKFLLLQSIIEQI